MVKKGVVRFLQEATVSSGFLLMFSTPFFTPLAAATSYVTVDSAPYKRFVRVYHTNTVRGSTHMILIFRSVQRKRFSCSPGTSLCWSCPVMSWRAVQPVS